MAERYVLISILAVAISSGLISAQTARNISIVGNEFSLDGQPLQLVSGSLHYFRVPAVYWRDRLMMLKNAGLNSISTYVEWSFHETEERQYSFQGDTDLAQFIKLADEVGLHVLLRVGPYICAERDLGGLPYWLLGKYPQISLRSTDPDFINETQIWFEKLFNQVTPLLYGNGGPIILVQIENEYGSYGTDKAYMIQLRDIIRGHVGDAALLYTTDGPYRSMYSQGSVDGALTTIDFGPGTNVRDTFSSFRQYLTQGPLMNSEYYPGWLTHWGEQFQGRSTDAVVKTMQDMLNDKINFNFYMFFGGTNFEFTSGANFGTFYQPDITSYDYDAPVSEAGDPTPKYYAIRKALEEYFPEVQSLDLPVPRQKGSYGTVSMVPKVRIFSPDGRLALGKSYGERNGAIPPTFESLRQRSGLILYETTLQGNDSVTQGSLYIDRPADRVYVYVDSEYQGLVNRMDVQPQAVNITYKNNSTLSLLVENQGRIGFGSKIHDFKGILSNVLVSDQELPGPWRITGYPLECLEAVQSKVMLDATTGPLLYEGNFTLNDEPRDTFLDTTGWGKGYVWINGHNLGRYWPSEGPQVTLYIPDTYLKPAPANNQLLVLELETPAQSQALNLIDYPILNRTKASGSDAAWDMFPDAS